MDLFRRDVDLRLPFRPTIARGVLAAAFVLHVTAAFGYYAIPVLCRSVDLAIHFHVLGILSLGGSVAVFVVSRASVFRILMVLRVAVVVVLGVRFPGEVSIRALLAVTAALEFAIYERYPLNLGLGCGVAIVVAVCYGIADVNRLRMLRDAAESLRLLAPHGAPIVTIDRPPALFAESLSVLVITALTALAASLVSRYYEESVAERAQVERLGQITEDLSANNVRMQQLAFRSQEESREKERSRITREIHDAVGYTLTNLIMMMEAATDLVHDDPIRLSRLMKNARDQAKSGLEDTRRALRKLRAQEEVLPHGVTAYERLFRTFEGTSAVSIRAEYGNIPMSFSPAVDAVVYRFVQEGLTNAVRHGRATRILVIFWLDGARLSVTMNDNGVGAASVDPGIGLTAMQERASELDGHVSARNTAGGFEVALELTIPEKDNGKDQSSAG